MSVSEVERKRVEAGYRDRRRGFAEIERKRRERVLNETLRLLREPGATEESVFPVISKRFGVGRRYIENRIRDRAGVSSLSTLKFNEAQILRQVALQCEYANEACRHVDEQLDKLSVGLDGELYTIEVMEVVSGERKTVTTKSLPKSVAMQRLLESKIKYMSDTLRGMQTLMPQSVVNQLFDNRRQVDDLDDSELDRELAAAQSHGIGKKQEEVTDV